MLLQLRCFLYISDYKKMTGATRKESPFEGADKWYPETMFIYVNFGVARFDNYGDAYYYISSMVECSIIYCCIVGY